LGRLKKPPALPFAALHRLLWDYGIVLALWRDMAIALGGGRSFYSCIIPSGWPIWRRRFQHCLYLVGPQRTRYGFGYCSPWSPAGLIHALDEDIAFSACLWGSTCNGGIVVVAIIHLEWGSSSSSNTRSCWAEPNTIYFYINKTPCLGMEGPRSPQFGSCQACNWGPQGWPTASPWRRVCRLIRLGVNKKKKNSSRRGGDGGKANFCSYRRRRWSISPLAVT
jgi:hypothetical protein